MPEYQVLRCSKCEIFQIQQLKVVNKWNCTSCGTKQSKKKVYAQSFVSSELRKIVQEYNMRRGEMEEAERKLAVLFPTPDSANLPPPTQSEIPYAFEAAARQSYRTDSFTEISDSTYSSPPAHRPALSPPPTSSNPSTEPTYLVEPTRQEPVYGHRSAEVVAPSSSASAPNVCAGKSGVSPFASAAYANDVWVSPLASAKPKIISKPSQSIE
jgi:hypothetical protein